MSQHNTPTPLSVSLAEEIADDILKGFGATPEELPDLKKDDSYRQITQIIQRRVEPLEKCAEAAAIFASITDPMCYCFSDHVCARCEASKNLKQALARIKEGR